MSKLTVKAFAKINLTLEVVCRLPSGYHEIRTVFQQVGLCDTLELCDRPSGAIVLTCDDGRLCCDQTNLAWRAADLMRSRHGIQRGLDIHLRKCIPVGGGLAGGSSDGAATLRALNELWALGLSQQELMALGLELGMDVPFCVLGGTALGAGRGEILDPLPALPVLDVVIAHPGVASSTAEAYAGLRSEQMGGGAATERMASAIRKGDVETVAGGLCNVFTDNVTKRLPQIGRVKSIMLQSGAWNAELSGSGACVFALAKSPVDADRIAAAVQREFPNVFVTQTVA
jgi:4-diphosphocytidyl-2-C-methyl-D-erythritol kinase